MIRHVNCRAAASAPSTAAPATRERKRRRRVKLRGGEMYLGSDRFKDLTKSRVALSHDMCSARTNLTTTNLNFYGFFLFFIFLLLFLTERPWVRRSTPYTPNVTQCQVLLRCSSPRQMSLGCIQTERRWPRLTGNTLRGLLTDVCAICWSDFTANDSYVWTSIVANCAM